jgi:hypothetical protein
MVLGWILVSNREALQAASVSAKRQHINSRKCGTDPFELPTLALKILLWLSGDIRESPFSGELSVAFHDGGWLFFNV